MSGRGNIHTGDQDGDIKRRALNPNVATSKDGTKKTSVRCIAHLFNLVAAVKLRIAAGLSSLFNGIVATDLRLVGSAVAAVLAVIAHLLIPSAVIPGRFDLAGKQRGGRNAESERENGEDVEKHGY